MRTYTRRETLRYAAGGFIAGALAACTQGTKKASASPSVDLLYDWTYNGPPGTIAKYWKDVQAKLDTANIGGSLGNLSEVAFEALFPAIKSQLRAKQGATLVTEYADYRTFIYMQQGNITPMSSLVGSGEPENWLLASTHFEGKYWATPLVLEIKTLLINRKHFDSAGVNVDVQFDSYDQFIEACDRLKAAGITPLQVGTSDGLGAESWQMFEELQVAESPADLLRGVTGELSIDAPIFARTREQLPILRDKYMNPNPEDDTEEIATSKFLKGSAGMMIVQGATAFSVDPASEFEVVGFPKSNARFNRPAIGTGDTLLVMSYSENQQAAGKVVEFLHQPEQTKLWWTLTKSLPADARFDSNLLPRPARTLWDLIQSHPGDPYSLWWPNNFPPLAITLTYAYDIMPSLLSGASTDEVRSRTDQLFSTFRSQNPDELELVKRFIPVLDEAVAASGG